MGIGIVQELLRRINWHIKVLGEKPIAICVTSEEWEALTARLIQTQNDLITVGGVKDVKIAGVLIVVLA